MQVGKQYRQKYTQGYGPIITVVYKTSIGHVVVRRNYDNYEYIANPKDHVYEEYKPPRKGTVWVNIYPEVYGGKVCTSGHTFLTREKADERGKLDTLSRIACIEVPWVEGQGLEEKQCACRGARNVCMCA